MTPPAGIDCVDWEEDLSALLDGELDAGREAALRAHLAGCDRCSARLSALRAVDAQLAALPAPEVPGDLRARLQARLDADAGNAPVRMAPPSRRRWLSSPGLAALAAAAAGIALYLALGDDPTVRPSQPPDEPEIARVPPDPEPEPARDAPLDAEPAADLALALELETVEDLEVIANLELLQVLVALDEGTG